MKYFAHLLFLLCLCVLLIPFAATADEVVGWNPDITWSYDAETATLTFSGTGVILCEQISPWDAYEEDIKHVVIGEGITGIGFRVFDRHYYLKDVVIPSSLTSIGEYAFEYCYSLRSIDISRITSLGNYAFYNSGLHSVTIPDGITVIPSRAFMHCESLAEVIFHDKVTEIERYAFDDCSKLTSVQLPNSLKILGESAFEDCRNLKDIRFNDGLEVIGYAAVRNCPALESIVIPDSVKQLGGCVFNGCTNLKSIHFGAGISSFNATSLQNTPSLLTYTVSPANTYLEVYHYGLYIKQTRELISVARAYEGPFTVKEGTVSIGYCACDAGKITSLSIPNSVKTIGLRAFDQCVNLQNIDLGEGVETFKDSVFQGCAVTELVIPASVKKIGYGVFNFCTSLKKVTFEGLPPESEAAFYGTADVVAYYPVYMEEWRDADIRKKNFLLYAPDCKGRHDLRWEVIKAPTCTESGWRSETWCIICRQDVDPEGELAATGHSYGAWITVSSPTTEKEGVSKRTCSTCGASEKRSIPKLQQPTEPPTSEPSMPPETIPSQTATSEPPVENPTMPPVSEPSAPPVTIPSVPEETEEDPSAATAPARWLSVVAVAGVSVLIGMVTALLIFAFKKPKP